MNKKEISELRARLNPEKNNISRVVGCYVNDKREVISAFNLSPHTLPAEELESYLALFKKTLSGAEGKNLIDMPFRTEDVGDSEEHALLMRLRETKLDDEDALHAFCDRVIEHYEGEGNYVILLMQDEYDVPYRGHDDLRVADASEEVFSYFICAICPVKMTKSALSYVAREQEFHARGADWIVAAPEAGFLFPAFDDRASNIYGALYYARDPGDTHEELADALFRVRPPMPAPAQREAFQTALTDTLKENCSYELVQTVQDQLRDMIAENDADKEAEPLTLTGRDMARVLEKSGVPEAEVEVFTQRFDESFGETATVAAKNLIDDKKLELKTADVKIQVSPDKSELIETRVIDGLKYILIRADEGVEVNGVRISIREEA